MVAHVIELTHSSDQHMLVAMTDATMDANKHDKGAMMGATTDATMGAATSARRARRRAR